MSESQQIAWLRKALTHNLIDEVRKLGAAARDESSAWLASDKSSPSEQVERNEQLLRLAEALAILPEDQRRALELHHLMGFPVAEVGQLMGRTEGAVGALLVRALKKLRGLLQAKEPG